MNEIVLLSLACYFTFSVIKNSLIRIKDYRLELVIIIMLLEITIINSILYGVYLVVRSLIYV